MPRKRPSYPSIIFIQSFGLPLNLISDHDIRFTSRFWTSFILLLGMEHGMIQSTKRRSMYRQSNKPWSSFLVFVFLNFVFFYVSNVVLWMGDLKRWTSLQRGGDAEGREKSIPRPRIITSSLAKTPAILDSVPSSPPWLSKSTIPTSLHFPISSNGDLSEAAFPKSSISTNSDPKSLISESTLVANEIQRSIVDTTQQQVLADTEVCPPQIDYLRLPHNFELTIYHRIARILRSQEPITSISMKEFTAMGLHRRQMDRQTKVTTLWELVPTNFFDVRFHLYFNKIKIQGIQMESFEMEPDTDASKRKVCVYGCEDATGRRQWLAGIKYISHCECTNDSGAMNHHCPGNLNSCKIMPALFSCNDPLQQFPLDEENPIVLYFRYSFPLTPDSKIIPPSLYSVTRSWCNYGAVRLKGKDFIALSNYDDDEM